MTKLVQKFLIMFFLISLLVSFASAEFVVVQTPPFDSQSESSSDVSLNEFVVIKTPFIAPQTSESEFSTYSSSSVSSCACASNIDYITILNSETYSQEFNIYSDNENVVLPGDVVTVAAQSSVAVPYQINTPCDLKSQSYDIFVKGFSQTKKLSKDVAVLACQNLEVQLSASQLEVPICEPFVSTFRIENTGTFTENYDVELNSYESFVTAPIQSVSIPADSYADLSFAYQFECDMVGTHELSYTVSSQKSRVRAEVTQEVIVADEYNYSVKLSPVSHTCLNDQSYFEILVTNNNNFTDFFRIDVDAPRFVDVQFPEFNNKTTKTIVLNPNSYAAIGVFVNPTQKNSIGTNEIEVEVTSKYARTKQTAITSFEVSQCYNFKKLFDSSIKSISACGGDSIEQELSLRHLGTGNPTIGLTSGSEIISFSSDLITFEGSQEINTTFTLDIPNNVTQREKVIIQAYYQGDLVDETSFKVYIDTLENCYQLSPIKDKVKLFENAESFSLTVQNLGERTTVFSSELLFASDYVQLVSNDTELTSGRRTNLEFLIDRDILLHEVNDTNSSIIGMIDYASLVLENIDPNIVYTSEISIEFVDYPWYVKAWDFLKSLNPCLLVFFILSFLVVVFGIIGIIKTIHHEHFYSNNFLALIFLILFAIAAVCVVWNFGFPVYPYTSYDLDSNSTTHVLMAEDKSKTLDLETFFFDPDNNLVEFGVGSYDEEVFSLSQKESLITLTPTKNWNGVSEISLYVTDAYNESALSPAITVEVYPVEDYSFFELFSMFCRYINLAVLLILFIVIYVAFSFHPRPKEKQLTLDQEYAESEKKTKKAKSAKKATKKTSTKKTSKKSSSKKKSSKAKKSSKK